MAENKSLKKSILLYGLYYALQNHSAIHTYTDYIKSIEEELTSNLVSDFIYVIEEAMYDNKKVLCEKETWRNFLEYLNELIDKYKFINNSTNKELASIMYKTLRQKTNSSFKNTNIEEFILEDNVNLEELAKSFLHAHLGLHTCDYNDFYLLDFIDIKKLIEFRNKTYNQKLIDINNVYYLLKLKND